MGKRIKRSLAMTGILVAFWFWAVSMQTPAECPGDTWGVLDTMYVEVYPPDTLLSGEAKVLVSFCNNMDG